MRTFIRLFNSESGTTAIEYALIASLISIAAIASITTYGSKLSGEYNYVATTVSSSMTAR